MKDQLYQPFYNFWLDVHVLNGIIRNDEYLMALSNNNLLELAAWRNCKFIGATVPHIDPEKEVKAERLKLGANFESVSLTTGEQACENLNTGDFDMVQIKTKKELKNNNDSNKISE